jgi:hypothetical protein
MRSLVVTLLLALVALFLCGFTGWRLVQGNLNVFLGAPATQPGEHLYTFKAEEVRQISLSGNGVSAEFVRDEHGWKMVKPWQDRMDPRAAASIIAFTLGTRVADVIPQEKIVDSQQAGFRDGTINVRMEDADGRPLCKYWMGRRTAWIEPDPETGEPQPTVFIRPRDKSRKNYVYACTGDIHAAFKDGFRYLRDHQPFLFPPQGLQRIRLKGPEGELLLGREAPNGPWRIVKPLDLATDPATMKRLIESLFQLRAMKVSDRSSVTLPTGGTTAGSRQIAIQLFGVPSETVLEILPPESPDARTVMATVSDRPNAVFELPLKAEAELVSIAQIPFSVNELRNATLTSVNPASLQAITLSPSTGPAINLERPTGQPWKIRTGENLAPANEKRLYELLKAVTGTKATDFVTDAAVDFSPWGLDRPVLSLRFLAIDGQGLELAFGLGRDGTLYANRKGTSTVMKLGGDFLQKLATRPYQWRDARPWAVSRIDLAAIERTIRNRPSIFLRYDDLDESWKAEQNGKDVTAELDPNRANFLAVSLENLQVERWLAPDDAEANAALADPAMTVTVAMKRSNDDGDYTGELDRLELLIAPSGDNRMFYGRLRSDPNPFLVDRETVMKFTVDLLGEN